MWISRLRRTLVTFAFFIILIVKSPSSCSADFWIVKMQDSLLLKYLNSSTEYQSFWPPKVFERNRFQVRSYNRGLRPLTLAIGSVSAIIFKSAADWFRFFREFKITGFHFESSDPVGFWLLNSQISGIWLADNAHCAASHDLKSTFESSKPGSSSSASIESTIEDDIDGLLLGLSKGPADDNGCMAGIDDEEEIDLSSIEDATSLTFSCSIKKSRFFKFDCNLAKLMVSLGLYIWYKSLSTSEFFTVS